MPYTNKLTHWTSGLKRRTGFVNAHHLRASGLDELNTPERWNVALRFSIWELSDMRYTRHYPETTKRCWQLSCTEEERV
jgi:hypothetical protein